MPRKGDLSVNMMLQAELAQLIEHSDSLLVGNILLQTAIVTMAAVQIAAMGDVPLQGKSFRRNELVRGRIRQWKIAFVSPQFRFRLQQQPPLPRLFQHPIHLTDRLTLTCGYLARVMLLKNDFQRKQVAGSGRFCPDPSGTGIPPQEQILSHGLELRFLSGKDGKQRRPTDLQQFEAGIGRRSVRSRRKNPEPPYGRGAKPVRGLASSAR